MKYDIARSTASIYARGDFVTLDFKAITFHASIWTMPHGMNQKGCFMSSACMHARTHVKGP
jgi:hypothetical protein